MQTIEFDAIIVGGGLAGLCSAAYLSHKGKKVLLLERGNLGGRAVTLSIKGFDFNFGAHAIYGRDTSVLRQFEKELKLHIDWRDFNPNKAKYDIGELLTDVPANIQGLFRTKILKGAHKIQFTFEILKTLLGVETGHSHLSIGKWMENENLSPDVKEMMLTLASSNFFTKEPEQIRSDVFFQYYRRLFQSIKPVSYIGGGWKSLINEFVRIIQQNNGTIMTKTKVESVTTEGDRLTKVITATGRFAGKDFIFCIPPKELEKVFQNTRIANRVKDYAGYRASEVFVYDIGLKERIEVPYTYIYDRKNKMFITDLSYYDETCTPKGGQLLQAIAYLTEEDTGNKERMEEYKKQIEILYDKHFHGWREQLAVHRISKRASAQEIKWVLNQEPMALYFPDYRNLFFAGDWCEGQGQLSELSFSSAWETSQLILQKGVTKKRELVLH